jgi:transcriptional regulator with XRE-family HTH domain
VGPQAFGALLHRLAAGLSQAELAERAGLSARGISDLERGVRQAPYPATLRRLAESPVSATCVPVW